jgi:hypothetical protein
VNFWRQSVFEVSNATGGLHLRGCLLCLWHWCLASLVSLCCTRKHPNQVQSSCLVACCCAHRLFRTHELSKPVWHFGCTKGCFRLSFAKFLFDPFPKIDLPQTSPKNRFVSQTSFQRVSSFILKTRLALGLFCCLPFAATRTAATLRFRNARLTQTKARTSHQLQCTTSTASPREEMVPHQSRQPACTHRRPLLAIAVTFSNSKQHCVCVNQPTIPFQHLSTSEKLQGKLHRAFRAPNAPNCLIHGRTALQVQQSEGTANTICKASLCDAIGHRALRLSCAGDGGITTSLWRAQRFPRRVGQQQGCPRSP